MLRIRPFRALVLGLLAVAALLAACSSDEDEFLPNDPPDTRMVVAPNPDLPHSYLVELAWLGTDPDGFAESYEWRISDNGPDGMIDVEDTLGLPWHRTVRSDSLFETSAQLDSFPADVANPIITDPLDFRWWQTHSFWVRAVDQQGKVDPTPASASFVSTTTPPKIEIDIPSDLPRDGALPEAAGCFLISPVLAIGLVTVDLDDPADDASAYRYARIAVEDLDPAAYASLGIPTLNQGDCLGFDDFAQLDLMPWIPDDAWSAWMPYVDTEDPEIEFVLPRMEPGTSWFLFLQARDRAEALTPTFRYGLNFFEFKVEAGFAPRLLVEDPDETEHEFVGNTTPPVSLSLSGDGNYRFGWSADAGEYAGVISGYRYAIDPVDPFAVQESEWAAPWSAARSVTVPLSDGSHDLVIAAQDNSDAISYALFELSITNSGN